MEVHQHESHSVVSDFLWPYGLYSPWNSLGQNIGVGSLSFLQEIFPTQGWNPGLPHYMWILYQLSHKQSPRIVEWVTYLFSRGSSQPWNQPGVSCIAGGFFTSWAIREAQKYIKVSLKLEHLLGRNVYLDVSFKNSSLNSKVFCCNSYSMPSKFSLTLFWLQWFH